MGIIFGITIMLGSILSGWLVDEFYFKKEIEFKERGLGVASGVATAGGLASIVLCIGGMITGFIYTLVQVVLVLEGMG